MCIKVIVCSRGVQTQSEVNLNPIHLDFSVIIFTSGWRSCLVIGLDPTGITKLEMTENYCTSVKVVI